MLRNNNGISLDGAQNHSVYNNQVINSTIYALQFLRNSNNNNIFSNFVNSSTGDDIRFYYDVCCSIAENNSLYDNTFRNFSKIQYSTNAAILSWENFTGTQFFNNFYLEYNGTGNTCFPGTGTLCDSNPLIYGQTILSSSGVSSVFPFGNILILFLVLFYFVFKPSN